jgi:hypothetical protein
MDMTTWFIIGGLALLAAIAALLVLNRSWGSFPNRAGILPPLGPSAPGTSSAPSTPAAAPWEEQPLDRSADAAPVLELADAAGGLVAITHPMVRRATERALERGGSAANYLVRDGEQVCFDFSRIQDPAQRQEAYDLMRRFNAGQDVDLNTMIKLINRIFAQ